MKNRGWFASNILAILVFAGVIGIALYTGNQLEQRFTITFPVEETEEISTRWNDDVRRVESLGQQFSIFAQFLRLEFKAPVEFRQRLMVDVSREELAAGASLPLAAASHNENDIIYSGSIDFSLHSENNEYCDLSLLKQTFPVSELYSRVDNLTRRILPGCIIAYIESEKRFGRITEGDGRIFSKIEVAPDGPSQIAIKVLSITIWSAFFILLLRLFKSIREAVYFKRSRE